MTDIAAKKIHIRFSMARQESGIALAEQSTKTDQYPMRVGVCTVLVVLTGSHKYEVKVNAGRQETRLAYDYALEKGFPTSPGPHEWAHASVESLGTTESLRRFTFKF
jgi:hypothetical protein